MAATCAHRPTDEPRCLSRHHRCASRPAHLLHTCHPNAYYTSYELLEERESEPEVPLAMLRAEWLAAVDLVAARRDASSCICRAPVCIDQQISLFIPLECSRGEWEEQCRAVKLSTQFHSHFRSNNQSCRSDELLHLCLLKLVMCTIKTSAY